MTTTTRDIPRAPTAIHLLSLADLEASEIRALVDRGAAFARGTEGRGLHSGRVVGVYFRKTSTRTRTAFSCAALRLGADVIAYGPQDLQENTGETFEDTGRVFAGMLDALVARTAGPPEELRGISGKGRMSVINAMTSDEHPTQALADLTTIRLRLGDFEGVHVLYLGEGNSTVAALALALARFPGCALHVRTPAGYGLAPRTLELAQQFAAGSGACVVERHDLRDLPRDVDVVYTTRWQTTGTAKAEPTWRSDFVPFRVTTELMDRYDRAIFMHDLPAHREEEVEASVLDGPRSIAFEQAETKLWSAMAVLDRSFGRSAS
jgi:ornithine carbamoyltransferase